MGALQHFLKAQHRWSGNFSFFKLWSLAAVLSNKWTPSYFKVSIIIQINIFITFNIITIHKMSLTYSRLWKVNFIQYVQSCSQGLSSSHPPGFWVVKLLGSVEGIQIYINTLIMKQCNPYIPVKLFAFIFWGNSFFFLIELLTYHKLSSMGVISFGLFFCVILFRHLFSGAHNYATWGRHLKFRLLKFGH